MTFLKSFDVRELTHRSETFKSQFSKVLELRKNGNVESPIASCGQVARNSRACMRSKGTPPEGSVAKRNPTASARGSGR